MGSARRETGMKRKEALIRELDVARSVLNFVSGSDVLLM